MTNIPSLIYDFDSDKLSVDEVQELAFINSFKVIKEKYLMKMPDDQEQILKYLGKGYKPSILILILLSLSITP